MGIVQCCVSEVGKAAQQGVVGYVVGRTDVEGHLGREAVLQLTEITKIGAFHFKGGLIFRSFEGGVEL